ncbi:MAG TPA: oxidoreductase [Candidatus Limnocylindria bacterium]|nr:oxidoreductase [Candidatus Limnocylindria bacterium]
MTTTAISKAVLITGCSTGIGRATALLLAERGYPVYATARRLDSIADLATKGCRTLQLDVCDEASMVAAVRTIEASEGAVGVLVNNAGYGLEGAFETTPMSEVRRQFETNVFGLIRLTQLVLPKMRAQRWGRIVNISSVGGKITLPGGAFYHATKHAVEAMSDALRFELSGFGIHVVIIEPGAIKTRFGDTATASIAAADGPYAEFNSQVAVKIKEAFEGQLAAFAGEPIDVARTIERAISAPKPRTRYPVTAAAHLLTRLRPLLPDRAFDAFLRTQFKPPQP